MSTSSIKVLLRYCAVQTYCPESSAVMFEREKLAIPYLCSHWKFPLLFQVSLKLLESIWKNVFVVSCNFVHVRTDGGKLSRLQVKFSVWPSFIIKVPEMLISFTSENQNHSITLMTEQKLIYFLAEPREWKLLTYHIQSNSLICCDVVSVADWTGDIGAMKFS